ncbi:MAG TPA: sigma-70 family RNA polymerase sigma factor [Niastella sp.]|nr:sigma-70 family RNA polymerase sigma factor [Niastella sp.]
MPANIYDTDQELFARVQQRDTHAFDTFYHRHFDKLYLAAFKRLKDQNACKDIVHDVFLDLWQRAVSIDNANIEAYLHTAVKYQVFKKAAREKQSHFYTLFDDMGAWMSKGNAKEDIPHNIRYNELLHLVDLWIETLPEKRKQIFLLHYREQLSAQEIAEQLNLTPKTVQNQLALAFKDLKGQLPDLALVCIISHFL